ncbi:cyanamide hydratase [Xylaria polymorpha]|nr:cyanamide hydratase [Xylaria polymorpha]
MKFSTVIPLALASSAIAAPSKKCRSELPTTVIAGVEVVDTQIVRDAHELVKPFQELQPYLYNHVVRTWLLGAAALNNNATLKAEVDLELHAVGSLLHDLGWDQRDNTPFNSHEYRFEVESGVAAVNFVKSHADAKNWDANRLERLYDGISLQTIIGVSDFKNIDTQWIVKSIGFEFPQPRSALIPEQFYDSVQGNFTNSTLFRGTNDTFTRFCVKDPTTTFNTFLSVFGDEYVAGYSEQGARLFDLIQGGIQLELGQYPDVPFTPLPAVSA